MSRRLGSVHGAVIPNAENIPSEASDKTFPENDFESSWGGYQTRLVYLPHL
jgi:hypothetical protein